MTDERDDVPYDIKPIPKINKVFNGSHHETTMVSGNSSNAS